MIMRSAKPLPPSLDHPCAVHNNWLNNRTGHAASPGRDPSPLCRRWIGVYLGMWKMGGCVNVGTGWRHCRQPASILSSMQGVSPAYHQFGRDGDQNINNGLYRGQEPQKGPEFRVSCMHTRMVSGPEVSFFVTLGCGSVEGKNRLRPRTPQNIT